MSTDGESERFTIDELAQARSFFDEHGFAIVTDLFNESALGEIQSGWNEVVASACRDIELEADAFVERFPQNRDLWMKNDSFRRLLLDSRQSNVAGALLDVSGVRLFHDHAIAKPSGNSQTIPWHQDNAYWPVDRVGLSLWTPVEDVHQDGGCLTILDGSHRDGPAEPEDFLKPSEHNHDNDPRLRHLPVARGETVVLHGLTWHCSRPNVSGIDRLAYLTLWIPSTARYQPAHADWHPTAQFIESEAGERVRGEWLPLFGEVPARDEGESVEFAPPPRGDGPSMFKAGDSIAEQIAWLVGDDVRPLSNLLEAHSPRSIARTAVAGGMAAAPDEEELVDVLEGLALQERVREQSVARDVYLSNIEGWWKLAGRAIREAGSHDK